jgi:hypothetical protein
VSVALEERPELEIESYEERGGPGSGFGFVYFNDASRVAFNTRHAPPEATVWGPPTNGGGEYVPVTSKHLDMALAMLKAEGVLK